MGAVDHRPIMKRGCPSSPPPTPPRCPARRTSATSTRAFPAAPRVDDRYLNRPAMSAAAAANPTRGTRARRKVKRIRVSVRRPLGVRLIPSGRVLNQRAAAASHPDGSAPSADPSVDGPVRGRHLPCRRSRPLCRRSATPRRATFGQVQPRCLRSPGAEQQVPPPHRRSR